MEELSPYRYRDQRMIEQFRMREDSLGISNLPVPQLCEEDAVFTRTFRIETGRNENCERGAIRTGFLT